MLVLGGFVVVALWRLHLRYVNPVLAIGLSCAALIVLLLLIWKLISAFLFKVGRRLAFSYFLLGGLPIPMVLLLLSVVAYLLANFFIGHLYRDALRSLDSDVVAATRERAALYQHTGDAAFAAPFTGALPDMAFAYYVNGRRVAGDPRTPDLWPGCAEVPKAGEVAAEEVATTNSPDSSWGSAAQLPRFFARSDHSPTLAAAIPTRGSGRGVVGIYTGDLDLELSRRSGVWVESNRPEDPVEVMQVKLGSRELPMLAFHRARNLGQAQMFFKRRSRGDALWDREILWWGQTSGPLYDLASRRQIADSVLVQLNGTPRILKEHLFAANGEIDASSWGVLVALAFLLANVYAIAAFMAMFMIVGLSRAVNRLSRATDAVRRGDFAARIPVRRRDQIGVLQRSFNEMALNLEMLVAASTQKELLEKELSLARDLQNSLIPHDLPGDEGIEFATLFEPSAAIGGDYFDVLRLSQRELAVIVADVSGHGLSTGLRMAMLKAALLILIEETRSPEEILRRLDTVVRANAESRFFVTATLAKLDLRDGRLTLTNAGHPPTYVLRRGAVEEILLPSSPLGGLGQRYAHRELTLERGDIVVWLSDGLFEGVDADDEPFGYDRIQQALTFGPAWSATATGLAGAAGAAGSAATSGSASRNAPPRPFIGPTAAQVRDRLLAAVAAHVGSQPPSDDRTLVVMRYLGAVTTPAVVAEPAAAAVR